jgi:hypothetical protein
MSAFLIAFVSIIGIAATTGIGKCIYDKYIRPPPKCNVFIDYRDQLTFPSYQNL